MSAETLRRAATAIREDYCAAETDNGEDDPFMFAVADWLESSAKHEVSGYALAVANAYLQETP